MSDYYNLRSSTHKKYLAFKKSIHITLGMILNDTEMLFFISIC